MWYLFDEGIFGWLMGSLVVGMLFCLVMSLRGVYWCFPGGKRGSGDLKDAGKGWLAGDFLLCLVLVVVGPMGNVGVEDRGVDRILYDIKVAGLGENSERWLVLRERVLGGVLVADEVEVVDDFALSQLGEADFELGFDIWKQYMAVRVDGVDADFRGKLLLWAVEAYGEIDRNGAAGIKQRLIWWREVFGLFLKGDVADWEREKLLGIALGKGYGRGVDMHRFGVFWWREAILPLMKIGLDEGEVDRVFVWVVDYLGDEGSVLDVYWREMVLPLVSGGMSDGAYGRLYDFVIGRLGDDFGADTFWVDVFPAMARRGLSDEWYDALFDELLKGRLFFKDVGDAKVGGEKWFRVYEIFIDHGLDAGQVERLRALAGDEKGLAYEYLWVRVLGRLDR